MKIELHKVTWYSWTATILVCVLLVPLFRYIWVQYVETIEVLKEDRINLVLPAKMEVLFDDPMNGTYEIDGNAITFKKGVAEEEIAPDSASKLETSIFGTATYADLNNDGHKDAVFFVTQTSGGSGTFYYVAVAINVGGKYFGTNSIFLGDRIAPQTIDVSNRIIAVNYAIRKSNEPMSAEPSIGVTKYLYIKNGILVER